ncbi:MAG: nucleoside-triphosphatase [Candidatus Aenigmatarchaeota archaeon]
MKIFISGLPRSGKTTLIKKIYELYKNKISISGFYTEEILKNNKRIGFEIYSIDLNQKFIFASKEIKSNLEYAGYYLFLENLNKIIDSVNLNSKLILIDEIGKMEMFSEKFKKFIEKIMEIEINIIATLHRAYINEFSRFGIVYWLEKEKWNETFQKILKIIENI